LEPVKQTGASLAELEALGLLTSDYEIPLKDYPYDRNVYSALYGYFVQTVKEAAGLANAPLILPCWNWAV
jgi:hypothetical protein